MVGGYVGHGDAARHGSDAETLSTSAPCTAAVFGAAGEAQCTEAEVCAEEGGAVAVAAQDALFTFRADAQVAEVDTEAAEARLPEVGAALPEVGAALQHEPIAPKSPSRTAESLCESSAECKKATGHKEAQSVTPIGLRRSWPQTDAISTPRQLLEANFLESNPSPAPHGDAWDWPLSRHEKKERVRLIDQHMGALEHKALESEIEQLRSGRE